MNSPVGTTDFGAMDFNPWLRKIPMQKSIEPDLENPASPLRAADFMSLGFQSEAKRIEFEKQKLNKFVQSI